MSAFTQGEITMPLSPSEVDLLKWAVTSIVAAIGAAGSLYVIDYGKLNLERFRVTAENQRLLLTEYLKATESTQIEVWKRKLHILEDFATDEKTKKWAQIERKFIDDFSEKDALYRETLKVASQLIDPGQIKNPARVTARARYEQLYWADLPFAHESTQVKNAMIAFRDHLLLAESSESGSAAWKAMNGKLIELSTVLRDSIPKYPERNESAAQ